MGEEYVYEQLKNALEAIGRPDQAAVAFSVGFYQALGVGRSIEEAYRLGCVQITLQGIPEHLTPILLKATMSKAMNKNG